MMRTHVLRPRARTADETQRYAQYQHYRSVEWAFVELSQFIFETRGAGACRPFVQQARRYNHLAQRALLGSGAKGSRPPARLMPPIFPV